MPATRCSRPAICPSSRRSRGCCATSSTATGTRSSSGRPPPTRRSRAGSRCSRSTATRPCYSPDPDRPGRALIPFDVHGRLIDDVWEQWLPTTRCGWRPTHKDALKSMHRIYLDAGRSDEYYLDLGAQAFAAELDKLDVAHTLELFDGTHARLTYRYPGAIRELITAAVAPRPRLDRRPRPVAGVGVDVALPGQHITLAVERHRALRAVRIVVGAHQPRVRQRHRRRREERAQRLRHARLRRRRDQQHARQRAGRRRPRGASTAGTRASGRARPAARRSRQVRPPAHPARHSAAGGRRPAGRGSGPSRRRSAAAPPARSANARARSPGSRGGSGTRGAPCRPLPYPNVVHSLDVSSLRCPMTWVRTKLELERLDSGETLEVIVAARRGADERPARGERGRPRGRRPRHDDPDRARMSEPARGAASCARSRVAAARKIPDQPRAFAPPPADPPSLLSEAEMERYSRQLAAARLDRGRPSSRCATRACS